MNISTIIVIVVVAVCALLALWFTHRAKKKRGCCGCPLSSCCNAKSKK
ncbi:MAG TPA: hypothetical protein DHU75_01480 [Rikenellaceae bacterium]|nr:hypothetical protein [Rikenellaceae bacterium]